MANGSFEQLQTSTDVERRVANSPVLAERVILTR